MPFGGGKNHKVSGAEVACKDSSIEKFVSWSVVIKLISIATLSVQLQNVKIFVCLVIRTNILILAEILHFCLARAL